MPATAPKKSYNADAIVALEGLDPVRKRPGMYIGGVGTAGLHHLIWEIVDNSVDEAMNGHASEITVTLHKDGQSISVADNGRGIPVDKHPKTKKPALEMVLTILHAGGKFEGQELQDRRVDCMAWVRPAVNALSAKKLVAVVKRDGAQYKMEFCASGIPTIGKLAKIAKVAGSAVRERRSRFHPTRQIFPKTERLMRRRSIRKRLEITQVFCIKRCQSRRFTTRSAARKESFHHEQGIVDYLGKGPDRTKSETDP